MFENNVNGAPLEQTLLSRLPPSLISSSLVPSHASPSENKHAVFLMLKWDLATVIFIVFYDS